MVRSSQRAFLVDRPKLIASALLVVLGVFVVFSFAVPGEDLICLFVLDVSQIVAPLGATLLCWLVLRRTRDSQARWSWGLIASSYCLWALGQMVWSYYELVLGVEVPTPSPADMLWVLSYPFLIVGLLLQVPMAHHRLVHTAAMLDALVFTLGLGGLLYYFILSPLLALAESPMLAFLSGFWPIGDMLVVFAALAIVMEWKLDKVPRPQIYLLAAAIVTVIADTLFSIFVIHGTYQTGNIADTLTMVSFMLMGLAALTRLKAAPTENKADLPVPSLNLSRSRTLREMLPYAAFPMIGVVMFQALTHVEFHPQWEIGVYLFLAMCIVAIVATRQILTLKHLGDLTAKLGELNQMAVKLSAGQNPAEAINTGLDMIKEVMSPRAGAVWLYDENGKPNIAGHKSLPSEWIAWLNHFEKLPHQLLKAIRSGETIVLQTRDLTNRGEPRLLSAAIIVAPLVARGTSIGALTILSYNNPSECQQDIELIQAIAAQLGIALDNVQRFEAIKLLADRDGITSLLNHRAVHARLRVEVDRAQRFGHPLSVLMIDLDGFKLFNDTYGHLAGDQIIRQVADLLESHVRAIDIVGRYGGDEFIVVLPETDAEGAKTTAAHLKATIGEQGFCTSDGLVVPTSASVGVACFPDDARQVEQLVAVADANLYESKQRGGDPISQQDLETDAPTTKSLGFLAGLVTAVDNKDHYTRRHSEDVTSYALAIADSLGLSQQTKRSLRLAGLLHDVGKISVPDRILRKPGKLTKEELEVIKQHAQFGELIVHDVPDVSDIVAAIGAHHEQFDGQGYPRELRGNEIPFLARILAVADTYAAMTSDRPYRKAIPEEMARNELRQAAGNQLDPELVEVFLKILEKKASGSSIAS